MIMIELDLELTNGLATLLHRTSNRVSATCKEADRRWLGFGKDIDVVRSHSLLRDEDLFRAVDDEMTFRIVWALIEVEQLLISEAVDDTVCGPEHDWDLFYS